MRTLSHNSFFFSFKSISWPFFVNLHLCFLPNLSFSSSTLPVHICFDWLKTVVSIDLMSVFINIMNFSLLLLLLLSYLYSIVFKLNENNLEKRLLHKPRTSSFFLLVNPFYGLIFFLLCFVCFMIFDWFTPIF